MKIRKQSIRAVLWAMLSCIILFAGSNLLLAQEASKDDSFDLKLQTIEERAMMLHMVMKQLTHTYKKAKEDHTFMVDNGMDEKDIVRLESAFQKKIKKMIDAAVSDINNI